MAKIYEGPGEGKTRFLAAVAGIVFCLLLLANRCRAFDGMDPPCEIKERVGLKNLPEPDPPASEGESKSRAGKSKYNLFNPTPRSLMRDFNTDRPDVTDSPYTVDAGHFQLEMSLIEWIHNHRDGERDNDFSLVPMNLKLGLTNNTDLQLVLAPYHYQITHSPGITDRFRGFGDTELRLKHNLWGNELGDEDVWRTAFAILPFVRFPTRTDGLSTHHVEGGVAFPLDIKLPWGFDLAHMSEFDFNRNERNDGYGVDYLHTLEIEHNLTKKLSAYVEYVGVAPIRTGLVYRPSFGSGMVYALRDNLHLDAAILFGLTNKTDNFTLVTGLSYRF